MTKRTKRYGGFLIGDRVYPKNKKDWRLDEGNVIQLQDGKVFAQFYDCGFTNPVIAFMPNQLINLTRVEEKQKEIPELPPISEETAKELDERFDAICGNIRKKPMVISLNPTREHWTKRFIDEWLNDLPSPYTRDVYSSSKDFD